MAKGVKEANVKIKENRGKGKERMENESVKCILYSADDTCERKTPRLREKEVIVRSRTTFILDIDKQSASTLYDRRNANIDDDGDEYNDDGGVQVCIVDPAGKI